MQIYSHFPPVEKLAAGLTVCILFALSNVLLSWNFLSLQMRCKCDWVASESIATVLPKASFWQKRTRWKTAARKGNSLLSGLKANTAPTPSTVCCETKEFSASQAEKIGASQHSLTLPLALGNFFIFLTQKQQLCVFMYSRESAPETNIAKIIFHRSRRCGVSDMCAGVCLEKTESMSREWDMLIQSARRWINKFPPGAQQHRRICIIKKRRGVFRLIQMHLHLNAPGKHENSARRKASSSSGCIILNIFHCHFYGETSNLERTLHIHCVDTVMKNKAQSTLSMNFSLIYYFICSFIFKTIEGELVNAVK